MTRWMVALTLALLSVAMASPKSVHVQPYFELVERGAADPGSLRSAREATLYSLASMARLGVILTSPPKIYFAAAKTDCVDIHLEMGWARPEAERRCDLFTGMTFRGSYIVNMERIRALHHDPGAFMWWLMPHELWHLYQWQAGDEFWRNTPAAFQEATPEMHKFKVLDERRIIVMDAYVRRTLVPRAKAARARWNFSILDKPRLDQANADSFYALAGVLGYYLFLNGGWPKIVALDGDARPFPERLESVYGIKPEIYEQQFFEWLAAR
jgi:hypothetical protein